MIFLPNRHPLEGKLRSIGLDVCALEPKGEVLRVGILNLMPQKMEAEEEFYVAMAEAGLDVQIVLLKFGGLSYKTTPQQYMDEFYEDIALVMGRGERLDGLIITGAPLEHLDFEQVTYWEQLHDVYRWSLGSVRSTLNICWGAFAALRIFFGIDKHWTKEKLFGVFAHDVLCPNSPLLSGLGDSVMVPISRQITLLSSELKECEPVQILLDQPLTGPELALAWQGRHIFANGHLEYAKGRLAFEYERDLLKGLKIGVPANYFVDDDPKKGVLFSWQLSGLRFYSNWLHSYVANKALDGVEPSLTFRA